MKDSANIFPNDVVSKPLAEAIISICNRLEALAPGCRAGVCIASADHSRLERSIFPNLPETFQASVKNLPMGPPYIGCCTAAMEGATIITAHDLTMESRFSEAFITACLQHGIKSIQSRPVYGRGRRPIGTVVMAYPEPSEDQRYDAPFMEFAADAVGAILQKELDETASDHSATPG